MKSRSRTSAQTDATWNTSMMQAIQAQTSSSRSNARPRADVAGAPGLELSPTPDTAMLLTDDHRLDLGHLLRRDLLGERLETRVVGHAAPLLRFLGAEMREGHAGFLEPRLLLF